MDCAHFNKLSCKASVKFKALNNVRFTFNFLGRLRVATILNAYPFEFYKLAR